MTSNLRENDTASWLFDILAAGKRVLKPLVFRDEVAPRKVRFGVGRGLVLFLQPEA